MWLFYLSIFVLSCCASFDCFSLPRPKPQLLNFEPRPSEEFRSEWQILHHKYVPGSARSIGFSAPEPCLVLAIGGGDELGVLTFLAPRRFFFPSSFFPPLGLSDRSACKSRDFSRRLRKKEILLIRSFTAADGTCIGRPFALLLALAPDGRRSPNMKRHPAAPKRICFATRGGSICDSCHATRRVMELGCFLTIIVCFSVCSSLQQQLANTKSERTRHVPQDSPI